MNWRIVGTLVSKDFSLYFRNKLAAALTLLGLAVYLAIYFAMPLAASETLKIGLYAPVIPPVFSGVSEAGLEIITEDSETALKDAVTGGDYIAGVALPADFMEKLASGQKPEIILYFTPDTPEELRETIEVIIRELTYWQTGQTPDIEMTEQVLGPDLLGTPIPPRDRFRPLLAIFIIVMETMFLANLMAEEKERRTVQALLVTPMSIKDLFTAKGITGISLAFVQAALFMSVVGGLNQQPLIILVTLLLGAVLVTGLGFLIAAVSKDFMSVLGWGMLTFIIMIIPAVSVIFPGTVTGWVKIIPSYYLVDTVHLATNFNFGWSALWLNLLILAGFCLVTNWAGITVLGRRLR